MEHRGTFSQRVTLLDPLHHPVWRLCGELQFLFSYSFLSAAGRSSIDPVEILSGQNLVAPRKAAWCPFIGAVGSLKSIF